MAAAAAAALAVTACAAGDEPEEVRVTGAEYSFGAPGTLAPGPTTLVFENVGAEDHEMILARLGDDQTVEEFLELPEEELIASAYGAAFGAAGDLRPGLTVDLSPGRYALLCLFEAPDGTPHAALGMTAEIEVG